MVVGRVIPVFHIKFFLYVTLNQMLLVTTFDRYDTYYILHTVFCAGKLCLKGKSINQYKDL
jgi:hypothetical protein